MFDIILSTLLLCLLTLRYLSRINPQHACAVMVKKSSCVLLCCHHANLDLEISVYTGLPQQRKHNPNFLTLFRSYCIICFPECHQLCTSPKYTYEWNPRNVDVTLLFAILTKIALFTSLVNTLILLTSFEHVSTM